MDISHRMMTLCVFLPVILVLIIMAGVLESVLWFFFTAVWIVFNFNLWCVFRSVTPRICHYASGIISWCLYSNVCLPLALWRRRLIQTRNFCGRFVIKYWKEIKPEPILWNPLLWLYCFQTCFLINNFTKSSCFCMMYDVKSSLIFVFFW